ncbi:MAG: hypothetical protein LLG93_10400 [Deltaproteobacteria bacterium]|nr:hypothetical protein [Deltaproteobacteria bacterium]
MKRDQMTIAGTVLALATLILISLPGGTAAKSAEGEGGLGPQSVQAIGVKKVLMVAVRFSDVTPTVPLDVLRQKVVERFNAYVAEQSYGLASIQADFRGYVLLPDPIAHYKISPYNFQVDRSRIRKLIENTMTAIEKETDFAAYDHLLIIPAVQTTPGKGYGMICYCANPGMLSGVTKRYVPRYETLRSAGGKEFKGGVFVATENAHIGMLAHDYFHALAGIDGGKRLVPCLYDYERQSDSSAGLPSFEHHTTYMGPWDIMSQHFVKRSEPPPGISSFTKIRLGWIQAGQVRIAKPGETLFAVLSPLSRGGECLAVKIPLGSGKYYLIENRQPIGYDRVLPDSGILILEVDPEAAEGYGTVEVKDAGGVSGFAQAPYILEVDKRSLFKDWWNNIAVIPLWKQNEDIAVLVTHPDRSEGAIRAARAIQALLNRNAASDQAVLRGAIEAFKGGDFEKGLAIATGQSKAP